MLYTMRKGTILISALAFGAFGLFAQDELATYQTSMRAAAAAANGAMRDALTGVPRENCSVFCNWGEGSFWKFSLQAIETE